MSGFASLFFLNINLRQPALLLALPFLLGSVTLAHAEFPVGGGTVLTRATAQSASQAVTTWRYTIRPGDGPRQIADQLLAPGKTWFDLARFNGLADTQAAIPGSTLSIPVAWLDRQPQPARVTAVTGSVVRRSQMDNRTRPLRSDAVLNVGDEVRTMDGRASIRLADGSEIRLEPQSVLVFDRMTQFGRDGMADTRIRLERGALGTRVQPLTEDGSRFQIETPSAVAAVRGTAFRLNTDGNLSRLEVTEGQVAFGNGRFQQLVNEGYAAELGHQGSIRQMPLPPMPRLATVPATIEELPFEISWQAPEDASGYQINLIDRNSGAWLLSQRTAEPRQTLATLDNGNYAIEVAVVSAQGVTGTAATADFSIGLQARPALLELPPAGARIAQDEPLQFQWFFQGASEAGQVEISRRANFSSIIASSDWKTAHQGGLNRKLAPGEYFWRVVTEAGGSSVAFSDSRAITIEGSLAPPEIININYVDNQVRIFWRNVPMADGYILQLAQDPGFAAVLKEAEIRENTAALRLAPGQRYFVRLRGLSDGPLESSWSPGRELYVE